MMDDRRLCVLLSRGRFGSILVGNATALKDGERVKNRNHTYSQSSKPMITKVVPFFKSKKWFVQDATADDSDHGIALANQLGVASGFP